MQRVIVRLGLLLVMLAPATGKAWDVEPGVPGAVVTGHLPKSITLSRVDVSLQGSSVTLSYHGVNAAPSSASVVLTSFIDAFGWQGVAADHPDLHMPELSLRVNGLLIKDKTHAQSLLNGTDVTLGLKRAKLDPLLVAKGEDAFIEAPSRAAKPYLSVNDDGPSFPLWQLLFRHTWALPALREGEMSLQMNYRPRPAKTETITASRQFEGAVLSHCGDIQSIKNVLKKRLGSVPETVVLETITIPLQFANIAPVDAYLTATEAQSSTGLPVAAILACGAEDNSLLGTPSSTRAKTLGTPNLSILQILTQS